MNLRSTGRVGLLIVALLATTTEGYKEVKQIEHQVLHKGSGKVWHKVGVGLVAASVLYRRMVADSAKNAVKNPSIGLPLASPHELSPHGTHGGLGIPTGLNEYGVPSLPFIKGHESQPCIHAPSFAHHSIPSIPSYETPTKYVSSELESVKVGGLELVSLDPKKKLRSFLKKLIIDEPESPPLPKPELILRPAPPPKPHEHPASHPGHEHPKPYPQYEPSYHYPPYKPPHHYPEPKPPCLEVKLPYPAPHPPCLEVKLPCPDPKPPCLEVKPPCPAPKPPCPAPKPPCSAPKPPCPAPKPPCPAPKPPCSAPKPPCSAPKPPCSAPKPPCPAPKPPCPAPKPACPEVEPEPKPPKEEKPKDKVEDKVEKLKDKVDDKVEKLKDKLDDKVEKLKEKKEELKEKLEGKKEDKKEADYEPADEPQPEHKPVDKPEEKKDDKMEKLEAKMAELESKLKDKKEPKEEEPKKEEPKKEEPPCEAPPEDEPPCEAPPKHEPPCEAPPKHEPPCEAPPEDEPPCEAPPEDEPPCEAPPEDEPPCEAPPKHEPAPYAHPVYYVPYPAPPPPPPPAPAPEPHYEYRPAPEPHYKYRPAYPSYQDISPSNQTCGDVFLGYCTSKSRYRTIDGSCNNARNPTWGMAGTRYGRLLPAIYSDGIHAPPRSRSNHELPSARAVSFTLFPDYPIPDPKWTLAAMQYGQIIAHDMALIAGLTLPRQGVEECCVDGDVRRELLGDDQCMPIIVPKNDPDYKEIRCLGFTRGATDLDSGCPTRRAPAEQLTTVTHYLDLSVVYGSDDQTARTLRSWWGGRLNVEVRDNREWLPRAANTTTACSPDIGQEVCYAAGDERVNQNTQLTVLHIILMREHNRVAGKLLKVNPRWSDETTYQETRRIVTAMHQWISYYEWLPIFIGKKNAYDSRIIYPTNGYVDDYDPSVNPSVLNEHSTAAFRVFHSLIAGYIKLVSEQRRPNNALRLSDWFMRPGIIEVNDNMDDLTRGLATQPQQAQDEYYDKEITKFLFRGRRPLGGDLRAIDIQRNRDHGLATYNDFREYCGFPRAHHWQQFEDVMDQQNIEKLSQLYESPDDVDLTVGGSLEFLVQGSLSGPTFQCILNEQFWRTRVGDRFWFESSDPAVAFTIEQLKEIKKSSLARWFCDNGDRVENMQPRAFELPSSENPITNCRNIPAVDLSLWKDYGPELDQHLQSSDYQRHENVYYKK